MSRDALLVRRAGLQTTVQDLGRPGYGRFGVPLSGAMDTESLRLGNRLLDNPAHAAGLEMTLVGPELEALGSLDCAYTGADMNLTVNGRRIQPHRAFAVREGDVLRFGAVRIGARAYLCLRGGVDVEPVLGSRSTAVTAHIGGFEGRPLLGGDIIRTIEPASSTTPLVRVLPHSLLRRYGRETTLRIVEGPQAAEMREALEHLSAADWTVNGRSNRVGVRLDGPRLPVRAQAWRTEGVPLGAVQVPADGAPILLLADRQTTGGYPKPAVIAAVDLPAAGQLRPGDRVAFRMVAIKDAVELLRERESLLSSARPERRSAGGIESTISALETSNVTELEVQRGSLAFKWTRPSTE